MVKYFYMNKQVFIEEISKRTNLSKQNCKLFINESINLLKDCFYKGEQIKFNGFGKFSFKHIKARLRYLPYLKALRQEKQKFIPHFKPSKAFYQNLL